jgi:RimJ/RimL family protein N-acetyltransferase
VIETQRLRLRRLTLSDADAAFMIRLVNDPGWLAHIGERNVRDMEQSRAYIRKTLDMYERFGFGSWLAELRDTGEPIGTCGLVKRDSVEDVEIGYALLPQFRGQGLALEGAQAVLHYARDVLGLERIAAIDTPANRDSIRLLVNIGLTFVRPMTLPNNDEVHLYSTAQSATTSRLE